MTALRPAYSHLPVHRVGDSVAVSGPAIAFCCDDQFAFQTQVALASIFLNSPSRSLDIVVFAVDWLDRSVAALDRLARRFARAISVVRVSASVLPPSFTSPYLPRASFFRLVVPDMVDSERLLYLDADIIAQIDIDEVWRDCREDMLVGGVPDFASRDWKRSIGSPEPDIYVNSGVLLVNPLLWQQGNALQRSIEWLVANRQRAVFADQDTINNALAGSVYFVPARWNVTRMNQPQEARPDQDSFRGIFHFAGRAKPWMRWADPVLQDFYLHYARLVGLPAGYWVEAQSVREALAEAYWADLQGNIAKASAIYKRVAEAALAKVREVSPNTVVEMR
jgi:lipopolysaccharide biosynthesis glycosyltransferase